MFAVIEGDLAGLHRIAIAIDPLDAAFAAGGEVVDGFGAEETQAVEIDHIHVRTQSGHQLAAVRQAEKFGWFAGLPLDDHLQRQAGARSAITARTDALHGQSLGAALPRPGIDRSLTRAIRRKRLLDEHRERHGGRIEALAMLGRMLLSHPQQLRSRQQVEEINRVGLANTPTNTILMLLGIKSDITIPQGWSPGWRYGCVVTTILPIWASLPPLFQPLSSANQSRCSLSKCHWP